MKTPTMPLRRFTTMACFTCGLIGVSVQLASSDELDSTMSQVLNAVIGDSPTNADKAALQGELQSLQKQATADSPSAASGNATKSTVAVASRSVANAPRGCQGSLQYLDAQLPKYTDPSLVTLREQLLGQSVTETMRDAKAKGYTKPRAVRELTDAAASGDKSSEQGKQCAIETSVGGDADAPWTNWNSDSTHELQCEGVLGACKCAYVMGKYTSIVMHALAAQLSTCWNEE